MEKDETIRRLRDARLLLVLGGTPDPLDVAGAAVDAGVRAVEVSLAEGAGALTAVAHARRGVLVGAAGVETAQQAWDAVAAGARFVTAAPLTEEIAAVCDAADVVVVAAVADEHGVPDVLPLRPDLVRLPAAPSVPRREWPPIIVDAPGADSESLRRVWIMGALVALAVRTLGAASPLDLRRRLEVLMRSDGED